MLEEGYPASCTTAYEAISPGEERRHYTQPCVQHTARRFHIPQESRNGLPRPYPDAGTRLDCGQQRRSLLRPCQGHVEELRRHVSLCPLVDYGTRHDDVLEL